LSYEVGERHIVELDEDRVLITAKARLAGHFSGPVWIKRRRDAYCGIGSVFFQDETVSLS